MNKIIPAILVVIAVTIIVLTIFIFTSEEEITKDNHKLKEALGTDANFKDIVTLHKILSACENQGYGLDIYREFTNATHHIDNNQCEWHTNEHPKHPLHFANSP